jgi:hypothetical protein
VGPACPNWERYERAKSSSATFALGVELNDDDGDATEVVGLNLVRGGGEERDDSGVTDSLSLIRVAVWKAKFCVLCHAQHIK